jgi:SAM-dependent methyltransferase
VNREPVPHSSYKPVVHHKSVVHELVASVHRVGPANTLLALASRINDLMFDWRYGLETARRIELSELTIKSDSATRGSPYQPTGVWAFRQIFRKVNIPKPAVFVDYGCGKGRALVLACLEDVESGVGIEFSEELCDIAENNVRAIQHKLHRKSQFQVLCMDATKYEYLGNENVFYFFYPFDEVIMQSVLSDIVRSVDEVPREAVVIIHCPFTHPRWALDESRLFGLERTFSVFGNECRVYRHRT